MKILSKFLGDFFEIAPKKQKIAAIGGGVGTAQLLRGLKKYSDLDLTAIISMADDGGSAGRVRRAFDIQPPGDLITCLAALSADESVVKDMLLYRFKGDRYGHDTSLEGQKLGNLVIVALRDITGDFNLAFEKLSEILLPRGSVLPATKNLVSIWAKTSEGKKITGEENIDLGRYKGKRELESVHLIPQNAPALDKTLEAIKNADTIIAGPGDLYTSILPVLIIPDITKALKRSKAKKIFVVNVTNKPFETPNYYAEDYQKAVIRHLGFDPFHIYLINNNTDAVIPDNLNYHYVTTETKNKRFIFKDIVQADYSIHHDSDKLAKEILQLI